MAFLPNLAAAALAAASPSAGSLPVEEAALFDAFRAVCSQVRDLDKAAATAGKAGWEAVPASAQPNLEKLVSEGRKAALAGEPDATFAGSQYRREIAGRTWWMVLSRYQAKEGYWGNGCRLYDFNATAAIPLDRLVALMGKPNTGHKPAPDGTFVYLWEPGWKSGHSVEIAYVAGTDPVSQKFGLKGLVLTAQAIGGFK